MNFISQEFLVFIAVVYAAYFCLPRRGQNALLLAGSYFFYGWFDWRFLSLLAISSVVDYFCGLYVDPRRNPERSAAKRKVGLAISLCVNLGLLGFFKYFDFFSQSVAGLLLRFHIEAGPLLLKVVLPMGISFYTFQTMSYTIDVYRGSLWSTRRFFDFALFVSLFPQLVAGPIERASNLLPQVLHKRRITWEKVTSGAQLALWGFFKKMVIADNMAPIVEAVFGDSAPLPTGPVALLGTYAFAFQIYGDFSGYTDIARGVARVMGFEICVNFRLPYFATSPGEFWRRWHISLSTWLRDYLYIPLGGNRRGGLRTVRNLMITMLLGGLWHGAAWHFVVWGLFHGLLLVAFRWLGRTDRSLAPRGGVLFWIKVVLFFQLTAVGWFIFRVRVKSWEHIRDMLASMVQNLTLKDFPVAHGALFAGLVVPLIAFQVVQYYTGRMEPWRRWPWWVRAPFYLILFYSIVLLGSPESVQFIYFQF